MSFLRSPLAACRYPASLPWRKQDTEIGHNPAGGWMVLVILVLLAVQVVTGLCANDGISAQGPLSDYVGREWSDWHIPAVNFRCLEFAICVHLIAIAAYAALKRQDLAGPMITGRKRLPSAVTSRSSCW